MATVAEMLQAGLEAHRAGRLPEAERLYRQVLQVEPRQVDALHLLGQLAGQAGRPDLAVEHITQALVLAPDQSILHDSLAKACLALGRIDQALASCREALRLQPDSPEAHLTLGNVHRHAGRLADAEASYREALRLRPGSAEARNNLGNACRAQGRLDEAEECYREVLRQHPGDPTAQTNLGGVLRERGRLEEAEACHRQTVRERPGFVEAHVHLGLVLQAQGRLAEAQACYQQAVRLQPGHADAHKFLGQTLLEQDRFAEAEACFRQAVQLRPGDPHAHYHVGLLRQQAGDLVTAERAYRTALRIWPAFAECLATLGQLLRLQGRLAESLDNLREVVRLQPTNARAHFQLGLAYQEMFDVPSALASFTEAVRLQPDYAEAHNSLGGCLVEEGRVPEAIPHFHEALRLKPGSIPTLGNLATLARDGFYQVSDDELAALRTALARDDISDEDRAILCFSLGNVLDKRKQYDEAFGYFKQANDLKWEQFRQKGMTFDAENQRQFVAETITLATPEFFQCTTSFGDPSELPVFILGMPRSGTSLVEQILASHPQVHGAGELPLISDLVQSLPRILGVPEEYPACLARLDSATARNLAARLLERLKRLGGQALRVTDKMPANVFHLPLIHLLFPNARIIHCRRDRLDVCVSCYLMDFTRLSFAARLEDIGVFYRGYEQLAEHWRTVFPGRILEVQYEEMVARQEEVSRQLIDFCGLDWNDRCLAFHQTRRVVLTSSLAQVRQPIYSTSVARWKRYEKHLGPLLAALDAPSDPPVESR